jgi:tetratricopeptide (TPR) repeat protein
MNSPLRAAAAILVLAGVIGSVPSLASAQADAAYFEFLMARRLEAQGDNEAALAALQRAAVAAPRSAEVRAEIASFQLRRQRRNEAEQAAREALKLDDDNPEAHRVLGVIYAALVDGARGQNAQVEANAREAIDHLEKATAPAAGTPDINLTFTLGRLYLRIGDSDRAIATLTRVVNQNPNALQGRLALAQAYATANDLKGAIESLAAVVEDEPRVASTLAQYQEQAGLLREAADNYTRALAVQPMSRELKFRRAIVLLNAGEHARAEAAAAEAQGQHPDDLRFPRLRARAAFDSGARDRAFTLLEATARQFPRDTQTQFALSDMYNDAGRGPDAERVLRQLIQIEPDNADALNYLGYLLADENRNLDEAVRLIQRALDADPGNPSFLDSLGWAYYRLRDFEQAEKYLAPAADRLPRNSVIQDHLGDVLAGRGRLQDAIAAWTRALDGDGSDIDRSTVEKKIADARARLGRP